MSEPLCATSDRTGESEWKRGGERGDDTKFSRGIARAKGAFSISSLTWRVSRACGAPQAPQAPQDGQKSRGP